MSQPSRSTTPDPLGRPWSAEDSAELYQIGAWGQGYFAVGTDGHLCVRPYASGEQEIDLYEVVEGLRARGFASPILIRFTDILADRLRRLHDAFARAIKENGYDGRYAAVYPIKVNQQRPVVEEVYKHGEPYGFGLEVGSKPELLAVMALTTEEAASRPIVCNGFKDDAYIEAVILATKLGRNIIPVVEKFSELHLVLDHAERYGVRPNIGVRVKLSGQGAGRWRDSAGAKSKFGLFVSEVLDLFEVLRERGMEDCLKLVHCHPGSQLQDIRRIKDAVGELAHVYTELHRMGAGLEYIDVGGGLGVDYDGSRTNFSSSMNYTLEEYASEVVYRVGSICDDQNVPHPTIVSESGRAIAAYHSVLVFDVLGATARESFEVSENTPGDDDDVPQPIRDLFEAYGSIAPRRLLECYHDAIEARKQAMDLFKLGYLSLEQRGLAERLFWATCVGIWQAASRLDEVPEELESLELVLCETYFCNLSIFQSLPDAWAIGQLFPIMPIHRLDEKPERRAVLADITCDSDGRIERFTDVRDVKRALELHDLAEGQRYYLGAFLVGAYQETLGDLHNLFGDTHVVHIHLHEEGGWWIEESVLGDSSAQVLRYVQYDVRQLSSQMARDCERAVRDGRLTVADSRALLRFYESELQGYTYLIGGEGE
jgi:arginine decarboxylase